MEIEEEEEEDADAHKTANRQATTIAGRPTTRDARAARRQTDLQPGRGREARTRQQPGQLERSEEEEKVIGVPQLRRQ